MATKVFDNSRTSKLFYNISESLKPAARKRFSIKVKDAFVEKTECFEDLATYKLTEVDIKKIASTFNDNDYDN